jgi:spermidine/putrescine transport system permease protein
MSSAVPRGVRVGLSAIAWPIYILLYTPLVMVAYVSLAPGPGGGAHSLHAYSLLMSDRNVLTALQRSLILAVGSAAVSTALGTLLGYGLCRFRQPGARGVAANLPSLIIYTPIIMPGLVFGIAELIFFNLVHNATGLFGAGMQTIIIAHITFQLPYVALTVFARLSGLDANLFEASHDLYANGLKSFLFLIIPVVRPAIIGGFLLGLTLSIDDFTISFFTAKAGIVTLPIYIYSEIAKKGISPEINALATLMIGAIMVLALAYFIINRQRERAAQLAL